METDGAIFSVGRIEIPERRGKCIANFGTGRVRGIDERGRPTDRPTISRLSPFLFRAAFLLSLTLHGVPGYAHMCAGHEVALLACRREALVPSPAVLASVRRCRLQRRCSRAAMRCRRRYASGGARRCHIDRALVTGERTTNGRTRTNERTNISPRSPPFPQRITLFLFVLRAPSCSFLHLASLSLSLSFSATKPIHW